MREAFESQGYSIVENVIPLDSLNDIEDVLTAALRGGDTRHPNRGLERLILDRERENHDHVYSSCASVGSSLLAYRLIDRSGILSVCSAITGADPAYLHTMPLHITAQLPGDPSYDITWHQERTYYPWCPDILSIWFPLLRPSTADTGTMEIIPCSHRRGARACRSYLSSGGVRQIEAKLDPSEDQCGVAVSIPPGSLIAFSSNLVHRSVMNRSNKPRLTGILRVVNMTTQSEYRPLYKALLYED